MLLDLLALASTLMNRGIVAPTEAKSLASDAAEVASTEPSLFEGNDEGRAKTGRLLVIWSARESAGNVSILGDCSDPKKKTLATCASVGRMQTSKAWISIVGSSPEDVLSDGREALRVGLRVIARLRSDCKSLRGALRAYASGTCAGTPRARRLVEERCREIGC